MELSAEANDVYSYTKRDEFTSEIFKIKIYARRRLYASQLKKLLNQTLKLNAHKLKNAKGNGRLGYVTFKSEEEREKALEVLNGYVWKGESLRAKKAKPMADPFVKKRKLSIQEGEGPTRKPKKEVTPEASEAEPPELRVKNAVMPLWNLPYEEQLKMKENEMNQILRGLGKKIEKSFNFIPKRERNSFTCCPLEDIRASPVTAGYRNKCEFTVGMSPGNTCRTVGFRLARYSSGSMSVVNASTCDIIPDAVKFAAQAFETYVQNSDKPPFDPENHTGFWRQLTVRTTRNNDVLLIVIMHPQNLTPEELGEVKRDLMEYFLNGGGKTVGVTSLWFQQFSKKISGEEAVNEHVHGNLYITETILDRRFIISPDAFCQVNTAACEVLYKTISEIAVLDPSTVLLDVCCGTGTIGICLSKEVEKVIGIEMMASAIEDARKNAKLNDATNVEFVCGKVEDVLQTILVQNGENKVLAVVDPPRPGLHSKVIRSLRMCKGLNRLIYISCDPKHGAMQNFVDLCRPTSNQYRGKPFVPKRAIPVDLFPHTQHCELVVLLERNEEETDAK